ncbi:MAG: AIR synthase-related protein, partial [Parvibaculum sp.]
GGFLENIPRVLPPGVVAEINLDAVPCPPVFGWLCRVGNISEHEMLRTFNCGIGMVIVVAPRDAENVTEVLRQCGEVVARLGMIATRSGNEAQVRASGRLNLT